MLSKEINELECLTIKQAAKMCGICENTFRILVNTKGFPSLHVGRRILIPRKAFIEYLNNMAITNGVS